MSTPSLSPPPAPPRRHGTLILIVVFVLGLIAGGGAMYGWAPRLHRPDHRHRALATRMQKLLGLSDTQTQQFAAIVATLRQHYQQVHAQYEPRFKQLQDQESNDLQPYREQADNQIRAILNPPQRAKFDQWLAQFRRRHPLPKPQAPAVPARGASPPR